MLNKLIRYDYTYSRKSKKAAEYLTLIASIIIVLVGLLLLLNIIEIH